MPIPRHHLQQRCRSRPTSKQAAPQPVFSESGHGALPQPEQLTIRGFNEVELHHPYATQDFDTISRIRASPSASRDFQQRGTAAAVLVVCWHKRREQKRRTRHKGRPVWSDRDRIGVGGQIAASSQLTRAGRRCLALAAQSASLVLAKDGLQRAVMTAAYISPHTLDIHRPA